LAAPIKKQPVLEKRPQDTGEQRRAVLPDIEEKAGEGKRLALPQDAVDPRVDIFAAVALLVEPAFDRHKHAMNHRAKRDRPIVMPPKDVRISVPKTGVISNANREPVAFTKASGCEIDER
jgi:hypothetical protein